MPSLGLTDPRALHNIVTTGVYARLFNARVASTSTTDTLLLSSVLSSRDVTLEDVPDLIQGLEALKSRLAGVSTKLAGAGAAVTESHAEFEAAQAKAIARADSAEKKGGGRIVL